MTIDTGSGDRWEPPERIPVFDMHVCDVLDELVVTMEFPCGTYFPDREMWDAIMQQLQDFYDRAWLEANARPDDDDDTS